MPLQFSQDIIEKATKPVIVMAFAPWCPHCIRMEPIYEEVAEELGDDYIFTKFDIEKYPDFTTEFKIQSLPTLILIDNKKEVTRKMGEMRKNDLKQLIQESFAK
jgi:thioredoxin 1